MGHSYSDFATYTTEFCGKEHPHKPHDNGYMYHENTCPGFKVEEAHGYTTARYNEIVNTFTAGGTREPAKLCDRCGSLVLVVETHDKWHEKLEAL